MSTRITVDAGVPRARVVLTAGAVVPRLIERGPSSARIALVAGGALLLGGDCVDIAITVGDGCTLDLEDIGATVAYGADGVASFWDADVTLGVDARLRWAGLPLIVADGADVHRSTRIRLGDGAIALVRESIVLGRSGERGGRVRARTSVVDAHGPVLEEALDAEGALPVPGVLGAHRVLDTIIHAGDRPEKPAVPGVAYLELSTPGSIARFLGDAAHSSPLTEVWNEWSPALADSARRSHVDAGPRAPELSSRGGVEG